MTLKVCVDSSCHLKGSYAVIEELKKVIAEYGLEKEINLQASFCLGRCSTGVSAKVDDEYLEGLSAENARTVFIEKILPRVR